jgi:hypothetical protein
MAKKKKTNPIQALAPLLVEAIPQAIASLKPTRPIAVVRISYYNTCAPSTYLSLRTVSAECRARVLASKGRNAPFYLWSSGEECGDGNIDIPPEEPSDAGYKPIAELCAQVYDLLCEDEKEDEHMGLFRQMIQQVALQLNSRDWKPICPVTDDFVVTAADGSQHFADDYEDLVNSIPADRLALLRSRGLLGPGENWDQLP